jgi:DNA-binding LacI/PurR family transcriptional regulator
LPRTGPICQGPSRTDDRAAPLANLPGQMATLAEVARHAGVSQSTVSYVLSGKRTISAATRRRVEKSIRDLGYRPHAGARALASRRTSVLALVTPLRGELDTQATMEFAISVVTSARAHAHDVLLLTNDEGPEGLRRVAGSALVDGLILMDVELHDERVPVLRALGLPAVLIGVPDDASGLTCVDLDFTAAGARCVDHLADHGHRTVALIGHRAAVYRRESGFATRALAGFTARARERGLEALDFTCDGSRGEVGEIVARLLARKRPVTGIVVHNETALPALLEALRGAGRAVPEAVSVVAIAPDDIAERASPPLSGVDLPADELGGRAVELLMAKLAGRPELGATFLAPRLVARASSGPAPTTTG